MPLYHIGILRKNQKGAHVNVTPYHTFAQSKQYGFEEEADIAFIDIYSVSSPNTSGSHYPLILTKTCNPKYCSGD